MANIDKALTKLDKKDPTAEDAKINVKLSKDLKDLCKHFLNDKGTFLALHCPGKDYAIDLLKDKQGQEKDVPWGPLYRMSYDKLLVLCKTITDYLDKGWIQASSSVAGAPVLFVKKPGGGLYFCIDYRALNAITKYNWYLLPLIYETLQSLAKLQWFTKINIYAAFHCICIKEGDKWKTAF